MPCTGGILALLLCVAGSPASPLYGSSSARGHGSQAELGVEGSALNVKFARGGEPACARCGGPQPGWNPPSLPVAQRQQSRRRLPRLEASWRRGNAAGIEPVGEEGGFHPGCGPSVPCACVSPRHVTYGVAAAHNRRITL